MEIQFKNSSLRRLIALSDKNNDGKIDFKEFDEMINGKPEQKYENAPGVGLETDNDADDTN